MTESPLLWEQRWLDAAPGDLRWHDPLVRVDRDNGGGWRPAVVVLANATQAELAMDGFD